MSKISLETGSHLSQIFDLDPGPKKTQNPARVNAVTPDPWPP